MRMLQKGSTSPIYIWVFTSYSTYIFTVVNWNGVLFSHHSWLVKPFGSHAPHCSNFTVVVFSTLGMDFTYTGTANWLSIYSAGNGEFDAKSLVNRFVKVNVQFMKSEQE